VAAREVIVVDASALLEALLRTPNAAAIESRLFENRQSLHAPHLLDVEVVLRRYEAMGEMSAAPPSRPCTISWRSTSGDIRTTCCRRAPGRCAGT